MQDILEKDTDCRTNVPSTVNDRNWTYKLADFKAFEAKLPTLAKRLTCTFACATNASTASSTCPFASESPAS